MGIETIMPKTLWKGRMRFPTATLCNYIKLPDVFYFHCVDERNDSIRRIRRFTIKLRLKPQRVSLKANGDIEIMISIFSGSLSAPGSKWYTYKN